MKNIRKVAAAQLTPVFLNKEKTVAKACNAILEAGKQGAKLIVFPEAFISGYPDWIWLRGISNGRVTISKKMAIDKVEKS